MYNLFYILFFSIASSAFAAPLTEKEANAELLATGMTQASIDGLDALSKTESENHVKSMPENDQIIYNNYWEKHEIA